jgi:uncharacterized membrane protein YgcG
MPDAISRTRQPALSLLAAVAAGTTVIVVAAVSFASSARAAGPPDILLGTSAQFSVLAGEGVTNTGITTVEGQVGSFETTTVTDNGEIRPPANVRRGPDTVVSDAKGDLLAAYNQAAASPTSATLTGQIGNQTLTGGAYFQAGDLDFTGVLTLDGENDPNSVFVIKVGNSLTTGTGSSVVLTRGAQACHVYWQIGADAVVEVGNQFIGTVLAENDISAKTGATFDGRLLSNNGAVTLDANVIGASPCAAATTAPPATTTPAPTTATPTRKPTPKPTKASPTRGGGGGSDDSDSGTDGGGGGGGSSDSDSGTDGGGGGGGGSDADSTYTSTPGLPDTGGPPQYLAPLGGVAVLAGLGLVIAARNRKGLHRS